ncbi:MAG: ATP:cob(I)alamin adenosyltransferase [Candidatus Marinimicrobia bacterium]|nr:ATP:cob(I)alamin adenosyltransferase [Candidatus Neomarinimicrobiota bacterium]
MKKYKNPNIRINKVYTKTGDRGITKLVGGQERSKSDLRIICYGEIDELNSFIGGCIEQIKILKKKSDNKTKMINILFRIQNELFNLGTLFATLSENHTSKLPKIEKSHIKNLEDDIDNFNSKLKPLKSFVLPGGSMCNTWFHLARTVCRRVERNAVSLNKIEKLDTASLVYLNRLSDALFVFGRWIINYQEQEESLWNPNHKTT